MFSPPGLDVANNSLPAIIDDDALNADGLLCFSPISLQTFDLGKKRSAEACQ